MSTKTVHRNSAQRVQEINVANGFPIHVLHIMNPENVIKWTEMMCRLVHVCIIETGFIPVTDQDPEFSVENLSTMTFNESVPTLVKRLKTVIDHQGSLHKVNYKAVIVEKYDKSSPLQQQSICNVSISTNIDWANRSQESKELVPITSPEHIPGSTNAKESGDGSAEETSKETSTDESNTGWRNAYSDVITVTIIHDNFDILIFANGPGIQKTTQISLPQYIRPTVQLPTYAMAEDYLRIINFSGHRFADDVKRKFCYEIMDAVDGLSFDIRSLSSLPAEVITAIAKRCASHSVFRLRSSCTFFRDVLSPTNSQFWKFMLKKDYPRCNTDNLGLDMSRERYYRKYKDMYRLNFRPMRRMRSFVYNFPVYYMSL